MRARKGTHTVKRKQTGAAPVRWLDREGPSSDHVFSDDMPYPPGVKKLVRRVTKYPWEGGELLEASEELLSISIFQYREKLAQDAALDDLNIKLKQLERKAVLGTRIMNGSTEGAQKIKAHHDKRRQQWIDDLDNYYGNLQLTRRGRYRTIAHNLLDESRVTWTKSKDNPSGSPPDFELLRKKILPPVLRNRFPHLFR